jgi:TRAP-type C4-dicarboxylate transport system permease small subunit
MVFLAAAQIVLRNVFDSGIFWGDPLVRALVLWVTMLGAMIGARDDDHIRIDVLTRLLPDGMKRISGSLTALFTSAVCILLAWHGGRMVAMDREAGTLVFGQLPVWLAECIMPFGFAVIGVRYLILAVMRWRSPSGTAR